MNSVKPFLHSIAVMLRLVPGDTQSLVNGSYFYKHGTQHTLDDRRAQAGTDRSALSTEPPTSYLENRVSILNAGLVAHGLLLTAMTLGVPEVVLAAGLPGNTSPVETASSDSGRSSAVDTDSIISERNSVERTRPFPVADKRAYFINIKDGDKVISPFRVGFGVSGMGIAPVSAGPISGTGHHHILIDKPIPFDVKAPIPFDKPNETAHQHYKHFGKGETETLLSLPPGKHTLQLLFADNNHIPYYIKSKLITIEVLR